MANTFKLKTKAGVTTLATVYTVPSSTTTVVLGLLIGNTTSSAITSTVTISSDTSDTETNADVEIITTAPIPGNSSLEIMSGNKIILQAADVIQVKSDTTNGVDAILSIMEIT